MVIRKLYFGKHGAEYKSQRIKISCQLVQNISSDEFSLSSILTFGKKKNTILFARKVFSKGRITARAWQGRCPEHLSRRKVSQMEISAALPRVMKLGRKRGQSGREEEGGGKKGNEHSETRDVTRPRVAVSLRFRQRDMRFRGGSRCSLGGCALAKYQIRELLVPTWRRVERQAIPRAEFSRRWRAYIPIHVYTYIFARDSVGTAVDAAHAVASARDERARAKRWRVLKRGLPGRGCRRFEVALILSRQGGDYSRGIVLRVHPVCGGAGSRCVARQDVLPFRPAVRGHAKRNTRAPVRSYGA